MINFLGSTFTWKTHPFKPDPHYKYPGGFVGKNGQVYHVRFNLEAKCEIKDEASGRVTDIFLGSPCRSEYTIARRNLFQVPSGEWRMAFSREYGLTLARCPSGENEPSAKKKLGETWQDFKIDIRTFPNASELCEVKGVIAAALGNEFLSARSTYRDSQRGLSVTVEYPINVFNFNVEDGEFQVCTGPIALPDLGTWDGREVTRVFAAHVAISSFDWVEFILQREVQAAPQEREWLDKPRGRDRLELRDPAHPPAHYPPSRPRLLAYNEVWELEATNVILRAPNSYAKETR